ncbi:unnamed protein product, partial [Phaeothamnion confervicola]
GYEAKDEDGRTALMYSVMKNSARCAAFLLDHGADPGTRDAGGTSPIMVAAFHGAADVVAVLLAAGADPDDAGDEGAAAVHFACLAGAAPVLRLLLDGGAAATALADGLSSAYAGMAPAHISAAMGYDACLRVLADADVNLETRDVAGNTPLLIAIAAGAEKCIDLMLAGGGGGCGGGGSNSSRGGGGSTGSWGDTGCGRGSGSATAALGGRPLCGLESAGAGGDRPMHAAARRGDAALVRRLLAVGARCDQTNDLGMLPAHTAAKFGQAGVLAAFAAAAGLQAEARTAAGDTELARLNGLDPFTRNEKGNTPVHAAALFGHTAVLRRLLAAGGSATAPNASGTTPAMAAAQGGNAAALVALAESGAPLANGANANGQTAVFFAAMRGDMATLEVVVAAALPAVAAANADSGWNRAGSGTAALDAPDGHGRTPLWIACARGHVDAARLLLKCGAWWGSRDGSGATPLWIAACRGHAACLELLTEVADFECRNADGLTPACIACQEGHADALAVLVAAGASLTAADASGNRPATFAAMGGFVDCLAVLSGAGADLDAPNADGHTPVFAAIIYDRLAALRTLADAGGALRRRDASGITPAMVAANYGRVECLKLLLKREGSTALGDSSDRELLTPAFFAVLNGQAPALRLLAEARFGADLCADDSAGRSPFHYAAAAGDVDMLQALTAASAEKRSAAGSSGAGASDAAAAAPGAADGDGPAAGLSGRDTGGATPAHVAAGCGQVAVLQFLDASGVYLEAPDGSNRTPLWWAAEAGQAEAVRLLLSRGAAVGRRAQGGATAAHAAAAAAPPGGTAALAVLAAAGTSLVAVDDHGTTPAIAAAASGRLQALELLAER